MKTNKVKEQLLAILTLASVFIFIIYLKMNPEISSSSLSNQQITNSMVDNNLNKAIITNHELLNNQNIEVLNNENNFDIEKPEISNDVSIIAFTESELNRAKKYQDRNWKADDTINMAAWEYILNNPNFNTSDDIKSDVEVVNVSK